MPVNLWGTATPTVANDVQAAEQGINLGTVFKANVVGNITHLRFYETSVMAGTVTLRLYNSSATVVASATFTAVNGDSGWREVALATPYTTTAGTWYMVAYHSPPRATLNNTYSTVTPNLSATRTTAGGELETAADGAVSFGGNTGNGRYQYGALAMPANTFASENYGADVVFEQDLNAPGPVSRVAVTTGAPASAASFTPTLPTHVAGDRITIIVTGKYAGANVPTISAGWTLADNGSGGTGATGNDVGTMFYAVFQKDATSAAETAPTITAGATAPNSWEWVAVTHRLGANTTWRDAISTANSSLTSFASDATTASPLTGTGTNWAGKEPTTGDAIFAVGAIPTDLGSALGATTLTATGLTDGTKSTATTQYVENALGQDSAAVWADWTGFTGTATAGAAMSFTVTGATNQSGILIALAVRSTPTSQATNYNGTATLAGIGSTTAGGVVGTATGATRTGVGSITAAAVVARTSGASLAGTGAVSTDRSLGLHGSTSLTGAAAVSAGGSTGLPGAAALAAEGQITAGGVLSRLAGASVAGSGTLGASGVVARASGAAVSGVGAISASGQGEVLALEGSASLVGTASITSGRSLGLREAALALTGVGSIDANGSTASGVIAVSDLEGSGLLAATGSLAASLATGLAGTGDVTASGALGYTAAASVSGTGVIAAGGVTARYGSAVRAGAGSISTSATSTKGSTATVTGSASVATTGSTTEAGAGGSVLSAAGTVTAAGQVARSAAGSLSGAGSVTADAEVGSTRLTDISGTGAITVMAEVQMQQALSIVGEGTISAAGVLGTPGEPVTNPQVAVVASPQGAASVRPYAGSVRVVPNSGTVSLED